MKKEMNTPNLPDNLDTVNPTLIDNPTVINTDSKSIPNDKDTVIDIANQSLSEAVVEQDTGKKKSYNTRNAVKVNRVSFATHNGHALTPQEATFIDRYIETGNGKQSVIDAGYQCKAPAQYAQKLLNKGYVTDEINYRLEQAKNESIASAEEIMQYFTDVMRGKIKDQFDMEASLSERTKAAQELAKRQIDIPNRLAGNEEPTLKIKLDFGQDMPSSGEVSVEAVQPDINLEGLSD